MNNKPKRSGFDAPVYGELLPKGTTFERDANGFLIPIYPKVKADKKPSTITRETWVSKTSAAQMCIVELIFNRLPGA